MRILVISSSFGTGGYGRHCAEVSGYLVAMEHKLHVLTCPGEVTTTDNGILVSSTLIRDPDWNSTLPGYWQFYLYHSRREQHNLTVLTQKIETFKPDAVFVWQGTGLHRSLFTSAEQLGFPVVYRLCDYWPAVPDEYLVYWQKPAVRGPFRLLKQLLTQPALWWLKRAGKPISVNFDNAICVSDAVCAQLRQAGLPLSRGVTIFNGIDVQMFWNDLDDLAYPRRADGAISLLYGGGLLKHKGVHVAIEAVKYLRQMRQLPPVQLTILGEGPESYVSYLHELVSEWQLSDCIQFAPPIPRAQMPAFLRQYDILLFPSLYEEPLARMMQEAMASGMVVVGTTTGGSKEILQNGYNGLVAAPGNAQEMAQQVYRLQDQTLYRNLAKEAQKTVKDRCDILQNTQAVANYLQEIVGHKCHER